MGVEFAFNAVLCCRLICQRGKTHTELFYVGAAGRISWRSNMHGLKSGSCRIWQWTDSPPGSNMHGLKSDSCRIWQRTDLPSGSNMLRLAYADSGSACKLAGVQIIPLPTLANQILARTFFRFRHASVCVPSRWKVLSGEFHRPPDFRTLYGLKWARSVEKRHGVPLSEARRCSACTNPFACPAVEKFCRASSAGGRLHLQ
jgi:hypothetical protein